ncbi:type III secretion system inner rod subunit SctI [Terasakiella pusilla]|jgi:type III secretion system YscI/HrpB-like protein|uniref:type III secretion system inner rod subunit SctI n=1 Tax=Terasakiella pusilla TaxID=64973 RepID=UPI00068D76EF|nr:type III secretion system inner rod subunit SctI [Terasakiella pusilla]
MVDISNVQQMLQKVTEKASEQQTQSGGMDANQQDVDSFKNAMNGGQQNQGAQGVDQAQQTQAPERPGQVDQTGETTMGTKILDNLQNTNAKYKEVMAQAEQALGGASGDLSAKEMMNLQMKLQQVQLQQDLMGKVASKTSQNVDTLLKGQ